MAPTVSLRVLCLFSLVCALPHNPVAAICGIVVLGLSGDPDFWDWLGGVAIIRAGALAIGFRRP